jgi:hypothetical protein
VLALSVINAESATAITLPNPSSMAILSTSNSKLSAYIWMALTFVASVACSQSTISQPSTEINSYHQSLPIGEQAVSVPEAVELDEVFTFIG